MTKKTTAPSLPQKTGLSQEMWRIALPSILANLSIPLLGLADSYIMGHLPDPRYLAAIALGAMIFGILYTGFNFLRLATTGFTAQAEGQGDAAEAGLTLLRAALLAVLIGACLILIHPLIAQAAFALIDAEPQVERLADGYFAIRIWSAPFALLNFVAVGWLLGLHRAGDALIVQIFMNLLNIALNVLFVYGYQMDVDGVALGTLCAEALAAALSFILIVRAYRIRFRLSLFSAPARKGFYNLAAFAKMFRLNRDIFIRTLLLTGSMATFTILGAGFGKTILAANAILMNLQMLTSYGLDGFAQAAEILVGRETGRRDPARLREAVKICGKWGLIAALAFSLLYALGGSAIVALLTDLETVRETAGSYLIWLILLPLVSVWSFLLDGIFIGATAGSAMRNSMVIAVLAYGLSLAIGLPLWANHGLWLSYCIFILVRAITLVQRYPAIEQAATKGGPADAGSRLSLSGMTKQKRS